MTRTKSPAQLDAEIAVALKKPRGKAMTAAEKLSLVREVFDAAAATLLDRLDLDGITIPSVDYRNYQSLLSAIHFVADVVDPRSSDPVVQQFVREYALLVERGLAPRKFR